MLQKIIWTLFDEDGDVRSTSCETIAALSKLGKMSTKFSVVQHIVFPDIQQMTAVLQLWKQLLRCWEINLGLYENGDSMLL
jgi:hypothetical protein